jgi:hypothetical protein
MDDVFKVTIALSFFGTVAYLVRYIGNLIFSGGSRGAEHRPVVSEVSDDRFTRLEQAVEAIAVEVERISEGQRFTTKLLAERANAGQLRVEPSPEPVRHTTPH